MTCVLPAYLLGFSDVQKWAIASGITGWLDEKTYREKIRPQLATVTVPTIMRALDVSEPYAANIRAGRCIPHPRHWLALAKLRIALFECLS
jgi:hypothetical protein